MLTINQMLIMNRSAIILMLLTAASVYADGAPSTDQPQGKLSPSSPYAALPQTEEGLKDIERDAQAGKARAQYLYALSFDRECEFEKAFEWMEKAARQGDRDAQYQLAQYYRKGWGVQVDGRKAVFWARKSMEAGNPRGAHFLSGAYKVGLGVVKDSQRALELAQQAYESGFENAVGNIFFINVDHSDELSEPLSREEAVQLLHESAERGGTSAQIILYAIYRRGHLVPRDTDKALHYLRMAAAQGEPWALDQLGSLYRVGKLVARDGREASRLHALAAEQGNAASMGTLAAEYAEGLDGVPKDLQTAIKWGRRAALRGDTASQALVAELLMRLHTQEADEEARMWACKSAEAGDVFGCTRWGVMLVCGQAGLEVNYIEGCFWLREGAEQGNPEAQYYVGQMYEKGVGVKPDMQEALEWYRKAADQGWPDAQKAVQELSR